jgi:uncharacterized alpha-E superfamily protein
LGANQCLLLLVKEGQDKRQYVDKNIRTFTEIKNGCQLVYGMYDSTISRNEGWNFGN